MRIKDAAAISDKGHKCDFNEDAVLLLQNPPITAVADGMGGPGAGNVAASIALNNLRNRASSLLKQVRSLSKERSTQGRLDMGESMEDIFKTIHTEVGEAAMRKQTKVMATTMVAALVADTHAYIAHVGDARAYLYRDQRLRLLTEDHTLAMARLRTGRMTPEEYATSPLKRRLYQALGVGPDVDVDVAEVALADDDVLLLCSDGLSMALPDEAIAATLSAEPGLPRACEALLSQADRQDGTDNISIVLLKVGADNNAQFVDEVTKVLSEVHLFRDLSESERAMLAPYLDHKELLRGEVLFEEGDPGNTFYVVLDGAVRITRGSTHLVDIGPGGALGELVLSQPHPRSATVTALKDTLVFGLSRERFQDIVRRRPAIGARIALRGLDFVGGRLRDLTRRLARVEELVHGRNLPQGLPLNEAVLLATRGELDDEETAH